MMISLVEVHHSELDDIYELIEVIVNTDHIIRVTEDVKYKQILKKRSVRGLSEDHSFTKINLLNGINIVVVGNIKQISEKISKKRMILG